MNDRTGGPAFPQLSIESGERDGHGDLMDPITATVGGMSLRDYMASHAPITLTDAKDWHGENVTYGALFETLAKMRFSYVDAMLAQRDK